MFNLKQTIIKGIRSLFVGFLQSVILILTPKATIDHFDGSNGMWFVYIRTLFTKADSERYGWIIKGFLQLNIC